MLVSSMIAVWLAGLVGGVATLLLARSDAHVPRWRKALVAAVVALALGPVIAVVALFTAAIAGLPALVALPTGEAITVFRGLDGKPYVARFQLGMNPPWTAPKPLAMANPDVTHTPSIAVGVDGHEAELAYVATDGNAYHTSLDGGAWSAAAFIAGPGLSHVAIATPP